MCRRWRILIIVMTNRREIPRRIKGKKWAKIIITTKGGIISNLGHNYLQRSSLLWISWRKRMNNCKKTWPQWVINSLHFSMRLFSLVVHNFLTFCKLPLDWLRKIDNFLFLSFTEEKLIFMLLYFFLSYLLSLHKMK